MFLYPVKESGSLRKSQKELKKKKIDAVYSSDLLRTKAGATLIASPHNLEVDTFSELREVCFGHWEGMNVDSVLQRFPDELACRAADFLNHRIKNGESLLDLKERVIPCVKNMVLSHPGGSIVCVSHSGVNRIILLWALSGSYEKIYSIKQEYACLNILNFFEDGHVEIEKMNTFLF
ncbi:MAG: histidine phosphatase family protein [Nitrospinota bacterium]